MKKRLKALIERHSFCNEHKGGPLARLRPREISVLPNIKTSISMSFFRSSCKLNYYSNLGGLLTVGGTSGHNDYKLCPSTSMKAGTLSHLEFISVWRSMFRVCVRIHD